MTIFFFMKDLFFFHAYATCSELPSTPPPPPPSHLYALFYSTLNILLNRSLFLRYQSHIPHICVYILHTYVFIYIYISGFVISYAVAAAWASNATQEESILTQFLAIPTVLRLDGTVCPGSSDPPEMIFNIFASENEVYTTL